jgi:hypothetical protein
MSTHLQGKDLIELLDLLEPVPAPVDISLMPQTPGWILLGVAVATLTFFTVRYVRKRHQANAYRRAALAELAACNDDAVQIAALLRRTALAGFPRDKVAGLVGADWLKFLDQAYGENGFSGASGQMLLDAPYRKNTSDPARDPASNPALSKLARTWIRRHQVSQGQVRT